MDKLIEHPIGVLTLVDKLIESMLAVGPWFSPHNGTSGVVDTSSLSRDRLAIGLHVSLRYTHTQCEILINRHLYTYNYSCNT